MGMVGGNLLSSTRDINVKRRRSGGIGRDGRKIKYREWKGRGKRERDRRKRIREKK